MSLFTNPQVVSDGTADRTFTYRSQLNDKKSSIIAGEWVEPAASLSTQSRLIIKHDESAKTQRRRLLQHVEYLPIADGTLKAATVNITITHHPEHSEASLTKLALIPINLLKIAGTVSSFLRGFIA